MPVPAPNAQQQPVRAGVASTLHDLLGGQRARRPVAQSGVGWLLSSVGPASKVRCRRSMSLRREDLSPEELSYQDGLDRSWATAQRGTC
jgi:hypothetical protein